MSENKFENLGRFAVNLNERAAQGKLDPVIGRDEEIRRVRFSPRSVRKSRSACVKAAVTPALTASSAI